MRVIGLYGIGGVYNFGCEAIVRGATQLIRNIDKDTKIIYYTKNFEYDYKMLQDLEIEIVDVLFKKSLIRKIQNKCCILLHNNHRPLDVDLNKISETVDEIWSIGGDIYTIPEVKRKELKYCYYNSVVDFCNRMIALNKTVILYGASVGPFGEYRRAIEYYSQNLKKYKMILAREYGTVEYLKEIGINNVHFFPDPALFVHDNDNDKCHNGEYIGINFSPLSLKEIYKNNGDADKKIADLVEKITRKFDCKIMLIPHVISKAENDDDLRFLLSIKNSVDKSIQEKLEVADYSKGFIGLKPLIRQCRFVVSARMHCAINAITENIPAIMISYSQKSIGMCRYIYGNEKWFVKLDEIDKHLINLMEEMDKNREALSIFLKGRNKEIETEYHNLTRQLVEEGVFDYARKQQ